MPFEDYMILEGEDIVEDEYCMSKLIDMALGHRPEPHSFDLNVELLDSLDVDEKHVPILKLGRCSTLCSIISYVFFGHPIRIYTCIHDETTCHFKKMNKIFVASLKWQHQ